MIAVVVLTYNRVHLLKQCVANVLARTSDLTTEIVIWNNGSTDGTREYLDSVEDPRIHVVHHPENIGQNAYAEAFRRTTAPYMVEIDDDMIGAPEQWDRVLHEAFEMLPHIGFLAADLEDDEHDFAAHVRYRVRPELYTSTTVNGVRLLEGPTGGGCAMTSRQIYDRAGGFRQSKRHIFWEEETAYLADIRRLGFEAAVLSDLRVHHAGGPHYSEQSEAKHEYWSHYWKKQRRKDVLKRALLRVPFVTAANARRGWFRLSAASEAKE